LRQLSIIVIETLTFYLDPAYQTFFLLAAGIFFHVLHLLCKPYDNRCNEELDILENKMLVAFVTTNALDLLLQVGPERLGQLGDVLHDICKWTALLFIIYLLMLLSGTLPGSCMEYGPEQWKAILESNSFYFAVKKGRVIIEELNMTERKYLALIMQEIDRTFCASAAASKHLRLGGARHEVCTDAVRRYYRRTHVPELDDEQETPSESIPSSALSGSDILYTSSNPIRRSSKSSAAEIRKAHRLAFLQRTMEVPQHVVIPIDDLHFEVMRSYKSKKFLQELHDHDLSAESQLRRPKPLTHKEKGPIEMTVKEQALKGLTKDSRVPKVSTNKNSKTSRPSQRDRVIQEIETDLEEKKGFDLEDHHIGFAVLRKERSPTPSEDDEDPSIRRNKLAFIWLDQTSFANEHRFLSTSLEDKDQKIRDEQMKEENNEAGDDAWNILDAVVFEAKLHQLEYDDADEEGRDALRESIQSRVRI